MYLLCTNDVGLPLISPKGKSNDLCHPSGENMCKMSVTVIITGQPGSFFFLPFTFSTKDVEQMKKEKEVLDQQLRSMGINPPLGPSYLPTPAEMRPGPSLSFIGQDKDNMLSVRDRSLTTESYAGDLSEGMFVSTKDEPKAKSSIRIRSNSESEGTECKVSLLHWSILFILPLSLTNILENKYMAV